MCFESNGTSNANRKCGTKNVRAHAAACRWQSILPNEWAEYSKPILEASGKYGFTALKEEAEAWHIKRLKLTVDNAVDEGLKKAVMDFIVENGKSVITSPSFAKLKESSELVTELMLELAEAASNNRKRKLDEVSA
jgi:hypothetical protein